MASQRPVVTVIMPALNEAHHLGAAFDSIDALQFPRDRIEVILVDNGSTDATVLVAREHGARVFELRTRTSNRSTAVFGMSV